MNIRNKTDGATNAELHGEILPKRKVTHDPIIEARRKWRDAETAFNNFKPRFTEAQEKYNRLKNEEFEARTAFNSIIQEAKINPSEN